MMSTRAIPESKIEMITISELAVVREQERADDLRDPLVRAEQALRRMGDSGGGTALAKLVVALAGFAPLKFSDLHALDLENSHLAVELLREYLLGRRGGSAWHGLGEFAQTELDVFGVRALNSECRWSDANLETPPENQPVVVVYASGVMSFGRNLCGDFCEYNPETDRLVESGVAWGGNGIRRWMLIEYPVR